MGRIGALAQVVSLKLGYGASGIGRIFRLTRLKCFNQAGNQLLWQIGKLGRGRRGGYFLSKEKVPILPVDSEHSAISNVWRVNGIIGENNC